MRTRKSSVPPEKGTLAYHIRERRLALKLNYTQAAKYLKVPQNTFWRWEVNGNIPTEENMEKIIAFLGYNPIQDLF